MGIGLTDPWADHSKIVCCLQRRTISSAERELASGMVSEPTANGDRRYRLLLLLGLVLPGERLAHVAVEAHLAGGDLAQRQHGRLVLGALDDRPGAGHQLAGALG